jgi:hypothetical protein
MDKKISQLTSASLPLTGTEELPIVQGGITEKATAQNIADLAPVPNATKIGALTGATTPLAGTEQVIITQGGSTKKVSAQAVANLAPAELPSQTGNNGKFLQTNGSTVSWQTAGAGASYKVYTASIVMATGVATVFQNTLGATPSWTTSSGQVSTLVFPLIGQNNVFVQVTSGTSSSAPKIVSGAFTPSPWAVTILQRDLAGVPDSTQTVYVEIRVYP